MNFSIQKKHLVASAFFVFCSLLAWYLKPSVTWYEFSGKPDYETIIPKQFSDWVDITDQMPQNIIDPRTRDSINRIYNQTLTRTYLHKPSNRKVMLSIAYGQTQDFSKQLHRPELCYGSNGFEILNPKQEFLTVKGKKIALDRFLAKSYDRHEYVSYFVRIGDSVISGSAYALNYARYAMSAKGYIADGLLFRVSELNENATESYLLQDQFINELIEASSQVNLEHLIAYAESE